MASTLRRPSASIRYRQLVLLLGLAIAPAKDHFGQWHSYQRHYLALIHDRGDAVSLRRRFEPGIHQIWLPELGVVDRCTTCHLGLKEASLADVSSSPFANTRWFRTRLMDSDA